MLYTDMCGDIAATIMPTNIGQAAGFDSRKLAVNVYQVMAL
jgi:hypothetical protein